MTLPKTIDHQPHDRRRAIQDAVSALAEYLWVWGKREDQPRKNRTDWDSSVPKGFLEDVEHGVEDKLEEMWDEAAKERALDSKADQLGMRY